MREIKFRGMAHDDWYYGDLIIASDTDKSKHYYIIAEEYEDNDIPKGIKLDTCASPEVEQDTVGQYTGLKDKNRKEIYEGDIIDFSYDMFVGNFDTFIAKGKIVFEEGAFYIDCLENERTIKGERYLLYTINIDDVEVIGNIYENKELLEG